MQGKDMKLEDWLDDLCVRFIINLPQEELISVERICFQVEEAQWFYEDFIRPLDPNLPSLSLKEFSMKIFAHCPLMSQWSPYHHAAAFSEFMAYKTRVPVRGAILLNEDMDKCVLVKGYKKNANWSFPRGKINKDEADLDCAIREVYEETGFDIREAGLLTDKTEDEYIEIPMREQNMRLYVIRGVSMDTHFEPRTRKEISRIEWYKISDLPAARRKQQQQQQQQQQHHSSQHNQNDKNQHQQQSGLIPQNKFYMVAPFLSRLKRMIRDARRNDAKEKGGDGNNVQYPSGTEAITEEEDVPSAARKRKSGAARTPALSEVPEVQTPVDNAAAAAATGGDPMATLKQVLNISGGGGDTATEVEQEDAVQPTVEDGEKSRTLLGLLRSGSASTTGTPPVLTTTQPPTQQQPQQQQLPPFSTIDMGNFTPEQQQHMPPPGYPYPPPPPSALSGPPMHPFGPHVLPPGQQLPNPLHTFPPFMPPPGPHPAYNTTLPPPMPPYPTASFPVSHPSMIAPQLPNPLMPFPFAQPAPPTQNAPPMQIQPQAQPTMRSPLAAAAAPYQRTGDPQFAQSEQQRGIGGFASAIPSANKLPPPKLSSHSLGLLSVLRGEKETGVAGAGDGGMKSGHDSGNGNGNGDGNEVVDEVQKGNAGEKNVGATGHASSNAAGDLLALLKRKPAAEPGVAAANVSGPAQRQVQPQSQPRSQAQTQAAVLPVRPKEETQARRKPQQQQQQATRGGRTGAGGDRGNEAGFSDSGRRNGSANVRGGGAGANRRGGMKTASTPDLGKRGRRDRDRDFEKEKEREKMKMKNVTILTRPQSQSQTQAQAQQTPEKTTMTQSEASAEARRTPTPPQHPRKQQQQQQQQQQQSQPAQSRAKPQPFQPQRILKRPDPTAAAATGAPTSAEAPLIPAADSKRLPTETVPVGSFAKPAKYGRPAIPAEPVKVNEAPRVIQRRKIPTFDDDKKKEKEKEREEDGKKNQKEEGRVAIPEQKQRADPSDGQKETLLNLFARPAEKPQQDQGRDESLGQSQKQAQAQVQAQASVSPAGANPPPGPSAPVADNKAFLLGYLNSVAKQAGSR